MQAHRIMAAIAADAADDAVLTKQLALQRYATSLLVRLRRLKRRTSAGVMPLKTTTFLMTKTLRIEREWRV